MYSFLSSLLDLVSIGTVALGRDASFGRSCSSVVCNAGSCERMKVVLVVRGVGFAFGPASTPTRSWRAAGLEVKNDRSTGLFSAVLDTPSAFAASTVDRIDCSCEMTASFRAHSSFSDRFSFFVSNNFLRCACTVSGVGVSGDDPKERP